MTRHGHVHIAHPPTPDGPGAPATGYPGAPPAGVPQALVPYLLRRPLAAPAMPLTAGPVRTLPDPSDVGLDRAMWYGAAQTAERRSMHSRSLDQPIYALPTGLQPPVSEDPTTPVWLNTNCPPWVCPPYRSTPTDIPMTACVPWYEVDTLLSSPVKVGLGRMWLISSCSYEALNASLFDVFQFRILVNGVPQAVIEDIFTDSGAANPAQQYALSGHFRTLPLNIIADRMSIVSVQAKLRGPINFNGASPYVPGTPITSGNCQMKIILNGWFGIDNNLDGAPRPVDLGDADYIYLADDQAGRQAHS